MKNGDFVKVFKNKFCLVAISICTMFALILAGYFGLFRGQLGATTLDEYAFAKFCRVIENTDEITDVVNMLPDKCIVENITYTNFISVVDDFQGNGSAVHLNFCSNDNNNNLVACNILIFSNFNKIYYPTPPFEAVFDISAYYDSIKEKYALFDPFYDMNYREIIHKTYNGFFSPIIRDRLTFFDITSEKLIYGFIATEKYAITFSAKSHSENFKEVSEIFYALGNIIEENTK